MTSTSLTPQSRALCVRCLLAGELPQNTWIYLRARRQYHRGSSSRQPDNQAVVPDNLKETLRSHRFANREALFRKVPTREYNAEGFFRPELAPDRFVPTEALFQQPGRQTSLRQIVNKNKRSGRGRFDVESFRARDCALLDPTKPNFLWTKYAPDPQSTRYPWLNYMGGLGGNGISRLSEEIRAFEKYMSPTPGEKDAIATVYHDVVAVLQSAEMDTPVLIGSRRTELAVPHSSVDFLALIDDPGRLKGARGPSPTRPKMVHARVNRLLEIESLLKHSQTLSAATLKRDKDPTLSAVHNATGLQVQFQCASSQPASLDLIFDYCAEFTTLRPLYMVLRMLLETRDFLGRNVTSVTPYLLTMMIIAALKLKEGQYHRDNIGSQLMAVLKFYRDMDFYKHGLSIEPSGIFDKTYYTEMKRKTKGLAAHVPYIRGQRSISMRSLMLPRQDILSLQDPADLMNDLGWNILVMPEVKQLFKGVHDDLETRIRSLDNEETESGQNQYGSSNNQRGEPLLGLALGANYGDLERFRDKILLGASQAQHVRMDDICHPSESSLSESRLLGEFGTHMGGWRLEKTV
ncbi:hypothetical protein AJ79_04209 [Helicocarpus griseus UAMH5409]|uniref:Polynucleotide adenylyltransferase n=1 Tax=Helicocarpus griseus UAMH5409 TaxID=1447875 RepID=A0A2B7XVK2_9EURO|nr:hypothetical protein AJ79_04209 [Helicocarpus griseus UAMH5409]